MFFICEVNAMTITKCKDKLLTLALLAVLLWAWWQFQIPCPIRHWVGIPCPGCGMSRAYLSLLQGDVVGAFRYHRMFWSMPILVVYYLTDGRLFKRKWMDSAILIAIAIGFIINWIGHLCA